jgi:hypothetical protein
MAANPMSAGLAPPRVATRQGATERWRYPIALLLGVLIASVFVLAIAPSVYLYRDPDSSFYLEAARRFLDGHGLTVSSGPEKLPATSEPLSLWPPGYPLLVALGSALTGVDPVWVAPALSWAAWALIPAALMFTLGPVLKTTSIYGVAALVMISPGAAEFAWQPMTDLPFLLLTILSLGLLFRGFEDPTGRRAIILAGLVGGLAYAVRNAGVALAPAVVAAFALMALTRLTPPSIALRKVAWWMAGFSLVLIPLQVRNLLVFGGLQPYRMDPSTLGPFANLRYFAAAALNDVLAVHGLADAVVWRDATLLAAALSVAALLWLMRGRLTTTWRGLSNPTRAAAIVLLCHALASAGVLIAARSRYEWGEVIGLRHLLQLDWILIAVAAVVLERGQRMGPPGAAAARALIAAVFAIRLVYAGEEVAMDRREHAASEAAQRDGLADTGSDYRFRLTVKLAVARDAELIQAITDLPPGTILGSNYDDVLRVRSGRLVQGVMLGADCDLRRALRLPEGATAPPRLRLVLFPRPELLRSGCWARLRQGDGLPKPGMLTRPYLVALDAREVRTMLEAGR